MKVVLPLLRGSSLRMYLQKSAMLDCIKVTAVGPATYLSRTIKLEAFVLKVSSMFYQLELWLQLLGSRKQAHQRDARVSLPHRWALPGIFTGMPLCK